MAPATHEIAPPCNFGPLSRPRRETQRSRRGPREQPPQPGLLTQPAKCPTGAFRETRISHENDGAISRFAAAGVSTGHPSHNRTHQVSNRPRVRRGEVGNRPGGRLTADRAVPPLAPTHPGHRGATGLSDRARTHVPPPLADLVLTATAAVRPMH
jgi:hypothetical protein